MRLADRQSPPHRGVGTFPANGGQVGRYLDAHGISIRVGAWWNGWRVERPAHDEPVGRHGAVQGAARVAVHVRTYSIGSAPRWLMLKCAFPAWSGSKVQSIDSHAEREHLVALVLLELFADALAAQPFTDREHVGPVHELAVRAGRSCRRRTPPSGQSSSNAPAATPPIIWLTRRIAVGTRSENPAPQVSSWSATQSV